MIKHSLPVPANVNIASMSIMEDRYRFNRIRNGYYVDSTGWRNKSVKMSPEDYKDTLMAIWEKQAIFVPGKDNYWVYITVNREGSGAQLKNLEALHKEFFPWIKMTNHHTSSEFSNGNYFNDNYLQLHIFKVEI